MPTLSPETARPPFKITAATTIAEAWAMVRAEMPTAARPREENFHYGLFLSGAGAVLSIIAAADSLPEGLAVLDRLAKEYPTTVAAAKARAAL